MRASGSCATGRVLGSILVAALAILLTAQPARSTVGGPTLAEVLGWDPVEQRIYVHLIPMNAGDMFGRVEFFALDGTEPERPVATSWSRNGENTASDSTLQEHLAKLRKRLQPLRLVPETALPFRVAVTSTDTVRPYGDEVIRHHVRVTFGGDEFEVTTFYRTDVVRTAVYAISGRTDQLYVLSFTGDLGEGGYETQVPVLARGKGGKPRRVEWEYPR